MLANGVPLKQIQDWLGHSDFSTTANIYAHLDYSSKLSSAQAMVSGMPLPEAGDFGSRWEQNRSKAKAPNAACASRPAWGVLQKDVFYKRGHETLKKKNQRSRITDRRSGGSGGIRTHEPVKAT